jgi:hypothetical protein
MIISVNKLKEYTDTNGASDDILTAQICAIEDVIRSYTHNNFQKRSARFIAPSSDGELKGYSPYIEKGDTVQISSSENFGIYVVTDITTDKTVLDSAIYDAEFNIVTKVEYPAAVIQCAIDLFTWKNTYGTKLGIKSESETLSRHSESVTYEDSNALFMGYPVGILSGLSLYKKARF